VYYKCGAEATEKFRIAGQNLLLMIDFSTKKISQRIGWVSGCLKYICSVRSQISDTTATAADAALCSAGSAASVSTVSTAVQHAHGR